jgi:acyl-CoA synthetase (AMP-forming)/AMP-acid ligase II
MSLLYQYLVEAVEERGGSGNALVYRDTYVSWRGLVHRVDRRAQDLKSLGITEGAWVGVMLGNVPDLVILALALSKIGAVMVPLDPTTSGRDLDMILEAAPLRALITRPRGGAREPEAAAGDTADVQPVPAGTSRRRGRRQGDHGAVHPRCGRRSQGRVAHRPRAGGGGTGAA